MFKWTRLSSQCLQKNRQVVTENWNRLNFEFFVYRVSRSPINKGIFSPIQTIAYDVTEKWVILRKLHIIVLLSPFSSLNLEGEVNFYPFETQCTIIHKQI